MVFVGREGDVYMYILLCTLIYVTFDINKSLTTHFHARDVLAV